MKRLFSVFMLAVVATLTFAFTTPQKAVDAESYHREGTVWVEGEGEGCNGLVEACQFTSSQALTAGEILTVANEIGNDPTPFNTFEVSPSKFVDISAIDIKGAN